MNGEVSYYHDRYGLGADAVLHLKDGRYALIEFKLVITATEYGYKREDGVYVIPIGCLKN